MTTESLSLENQIIDCEICPSCDLESKVNVTKLILQKFRVLVLTSSAIYTQTHTLVGPSIINRIDCIITIIKRAAHYSVIVLEEHLQMTCVFVTICEVRSISYL